MVRSAQLVGRGRQRLRLVFGAAQQHDGGDAADPVEEAGLQPRQREELAARGGRGADAGHRHADRHQHAGQPSTRAANGSAQSAASSTRIGPATAKLAAGIQRA